MEGAIGTETATVDQAKRGSILGLQYFHIHPIPILIPSHISSHIPSPIHLVSFRFVLVVVVVVCPFILTR